MKKYWGPILVFIFLVLTILMNLLAWSSSFNTMISPLVRIMIMLALLMILIVVTVIFIRRIREIKKEEKDDLSQY
ncbi:MAG: hypothetical protein J7K63_08835 [Candidatus Marinimicrobia bacterium]|nr:hypothetical protein [Candidatus Neomarinimicrobiota bacterium]